MDAQALQLVNEKKYNEALVLIGENEDGSALSNLKGLALMRTGRIEESIASFDKVLTNNPNDPEAGTNRRAAVTALMGIKCDNGDKLFQNKDIEGALEQYSGINVEEAEEKVKFQVLNNMGACFMQLNRFPEAVQKFSSALAVQPSNVDTLHNYATALKAGGMLEEAKLQYEECLKSSPDFYAASCGLCETLAAMNRCSEGLAIIENVIQSDPNNTRAFSDRAFCKLKTGSYNDAVSDFEHAASLGDKSAENMRLLNIAYGMQADSLSQAGNNEQAATIYKKIIDASPTPNHDIMFNHSLCLMNLGRKEEALSGFKSIIALDASNYAAQHATGLLALQNGDAATAISALQVAIDLKPDENDVRFNLALAMTMISPPDLEGAVKHFHIILEKDPNHIPAKNAVGTIESKLAMAAASAAAQTPVVPPPTAPAPTKAAPAPTKAAPAPTPPPTPAPVPTPPPTPPASSSLRHRKSVLPPEITMRASESTSTFVHMVLPYQDLVAEEGKVYPDGVNPNTREQYLSDDEFVKVLGCTKDDFAKMQKWKQNDKKRKAKLF